ncbi:MAG: TIM-barrel fold metal-dependent hydrolase [Rhizobium sp.]|nr:TIM-barrel fold metal-dependent hydrolase [Rhizobium sp.]
MKIDFHSHIVDRAYLDDLIVTMPLTSEETGDGKTLYRHRGFTVAWVRDDMFDLSERVRQMDAKGIDIRVLSLSTPNVYVWPLEQQVAVTRKINDAMARICKQFPDRFFGLASLPMRNVEASLEELDRAVNELGMKGVVIGSNIDGLQLDDPLFEKIWARIDALRLPVFEHPMFPKQDAGLEGFELPLRLGFVFDTTLSATRMIYSGVFERFPNFPYIMSHTGGALPMVLERLDNGYRLFPDCRKYISKLPSEYAKKLYYDTTSFAANGLRFAMDIVGSDHLLFGTDDPFIGADTTHVERMGLNATDQALVLGGNAKRLLGLK